LEDDKIIVEYSEDKEISASTLASALEKDGISVEMRKRKGRGLLLFKLNNLTYKEEEYPYLVAKISKRNRR